MTTPTVTTQRLVLRPLEQSDWPAFRAMLTSPRAAHMGGPFDEDETWRRFCEEIASWHVLPAGVLAITKDGKTIGTCGMLQPPSFPEPEVGWMLFDGHEGQGYATEAVSALIAHVWSETALDTFVSYIGQENYNSQAVATRLGAVRDDEAARPEPDDLVYRHRRAA
ncbi:MAG: GNAT family N-acetyltransferase [Pseudomonadota bacterium]